jgi:hypothetical protein
MCDKKSPKAMSEIVAGSNGKKYIPKSRTSSMDRNAKRASNVQALAFCVILARLPSSKGKNK